MGQEVFPIFYGVDPSDVRNQTGHFQKAFSQHEQDFKDNLEKVQKWRAVMTEVGNLSGFHLMADRRESEFIQDILKDISNKLSPTSVNNFVGMDLRLTDLSLKINLESNDVRFVGICGMGGIGKTTLANIFHSRMSCLFEVSSFLADVRKNHLISLQKKLLSQTLKDSSFMIQNVGDGSSMIKSRLCRKKVLVIIDDVDDVDQLEKLAGNHDWFGPGSRIIITARDEHLLKAHGVDVVYKAAGLNHGEALQLFSLKAFKIDCPPIDYVKLSKRVVEYADGLPLALEVFGSFLCNRSIDEWESALERLEEDSGTEIMDENKKIMNTLQISFDGLAETCQKIFLDIACFFKGMDRDYVTKILDSNKIGIKVLIDKCLIAISYNDKLWMHDLLHEMAKKIVQKASLNELGKCSRLWDKEDVRHVLTNNMGTEAVEGIISNFSEQEEVSLSAKAFSNMIKLRLLQIRNVKLPQGLDYLSNDLWFLKWHGYPSKSLPSNFHPDKIVILEMCYSHIQQLWKGIKEPLNKLKYINLSHSENLIKMPDFTWIPNLESMILEGCIRLLELHPSIGDLKRLIVLNLKDCKSLLSLPRSIKWDSLEVCILAGCSKLEKFSEIIGEMESLKILDVNGTEIEQFPPSVFQSMKNLEELSFRGWKGVPQKSGYLSSLFQRRRLDSMALRLPSLSGLCCLKKLDLSDCNLREGEIPNDLGGLSSLEKLDLSNNNFVSLPTSINQLLNLNSLYLINCKRLKSLSVLPSNILELVASNCTSMEILPDALRSLSVPNSVGDRDSFIGFNCSKLVENEGGNNLVFAIINRIILKKCFYDIVVPGSEIPKWFSHQSEGASTRIERTALSGQKIIGVVLCFVFVFHELPPTSDYDHPMSFTLGNAVTWGHFPADFVWKTPDHSLGRTHLWLQFFRVNFRDLDKNSMDFYFSHRCPGVEVNKFGIRLIHEDEVEELNQTINQCSSSTFQNFNGLHQDLKKSTLDVAKIEKLYDEREDSGYRFREFSISTTNLGAVWEDL